MKTKTPCEVNKLEQPVDREVGVAVASADCEDWTLGVAEDGRDPSLAAAAVATTTPCRSISRPCIVALLVLDVLDGGCVPSAQRETVVLWFSVVCDQHDSPALYKIHMSLFLSLSLSLSLSVYLFYF